MQTVSWFANQWNAICNWKLCNVGTEMLVFWHQPSGTSQVSNMIGYKKPGTSMRFQYLSACTICTRTACMCCVWLKYFSTDWPHMQHGSCHQLKWCLGDRLCSTCIDILVWHLEHKGKPAETDNRQSHATSFALANADVMIPVLTMKVTVGDMPPIGKGEGFCEPTKFVEPRLKPLSGQKTARVENMYEESREERLICNMSTRWLLIQTFPIE